MSDIESTSASGAGYNVILIGQLSRPCIRAHGDIRG